MKLLKIMLVMLVMCVVSALSISCASKSDSTVSENQIVTVQRGDLSTDITAVGNLALSHTEDLAFEIAGTVEEVLVEVGDSVKEGQVVAKLDTSAWEEQLSALEDKVTAAERNVTAKERAVTTAKRQIANKELAVVKAQNNLQAAEDNLDDVEEIANLNDAIETAKFDLAVAQAMLPQAGTWEESSNRLNQINLLKARIAEAEQELKEILAGSSVKVTTDEALAVAIKKLEIEQAQWGLEDAQIAVEDAKAAVGDAEKAVEDAKKALKNAQKALDEAKNTSPEIKAPFAGFITKVNVKGGDEVKKGTVAVVVADPNKFETDILVNEMDFLQVKLGGNVTVQVDAVSGLSLPAKVTFISPTATIQQGVVNYKVKVEVQSLEEALQEQQAAMQKATEERRQASSNPTSDNISSGAFPGRFGQAFGSSNLTQEQINQMMQQRQQAQAGQVGGQQQQSLTTIVPEGFQLREGLTVTISIVVDQRSDVLLVPNRAISRSGTATTVKVLKDGVAESRSITTGLSNGTYTEVISGLSEGEQVVIPQTTTTTTTTSTQGQGQFGIPGLGGIGGR